MSGFPIPSGHGFPIGSIPDLAAGFRFTGAAASDGVMQCGTLEEVEFATIQPLIANGSCRKNLLTASTAGQPVSTEAQLRCKTAASNPMGMSTADLRRPSSGSAISTSSIDGPSSFLSNSGLDNHVPHMICKF